MKRLTAVMFLGASLSAVHAQTTINLHENWIEERWKSVNPDATAWLDSIRAPHTSDEPPAAEPAAPEPSFDDPRSMLRFVLSAAPATAIVYPTETYYYYQIRLNGRHVSGNIRLLDADQGLLHIGYFDAFDRSATNARTFSSADGVTVEPAGPSRYRVTMDGVTRVFVVSPVGLDAPPPPLLEGETHVSGILDESGYFLHLLHESQSGGFYYVLNEALPLPERLLPLPGGPDNLLVGEESRFVFYHDAAHNRKVLCGVHRRQIMENNYFDGAFDQVPPRLPLRSRLIRAYPYVVYRGGIDEHGNFLKLEGQRVAISAYFTYSSNAEMIGWVQAARQRSTTPTQLWAALTYESKRDFRPDLAAAHEAKVEDESSQPIYRRQGWPANHFGDLSLGWPADHVADQSRAWPANHTGENSSLLPQVGTGVLADVPGPVPLESEDSADR